MTDIPTEVKVGNSNYEIRTKRVIESNEQLLGVTLQRHSRIILARFQSASSSRDTLIHEALHAVWWETGINTVFGVSEDDEERMIRTLAPALLGLIRDNPALVDYLTADATQP